MALAVGVGVGNAAKVEAPRPLRIYDAKDMAGRQVVEIDLYERGNQDRRKTRKEGVSWC